MTLKIRSILVLAATLSLGGWASAQTTTNVDFNVTGGPSGTYVGTAVAPGVGTFWNPIPAGPHNAGLNGPLTSGPLLSSTGAPTGITVTLNNFRTYDTVNDAMPSAFAGALLNDFIWSSPSDPSLQFTISNLLPGGQYDLYLYSQNGGYNSETTNFIINSVTKTATNAPTNSAAFVANGNYLLYSVTANASGQIIGFSNAAGAPNAAFNGFQLLQTPEPTSISLWSLIGLGLAGFGYHRFRRKK